MPLIIGGGALLGGLGGLLKSGPSLNTEGRKGAAESLAAFRNLVAKGPGEQDVSSATTSARDFANTLNNLASSSTGMFNFGAGNQLAEQAFAGQRQALQQSLTDQMAQANRAAAQAGRSTNDPIVQARMRAEAMRMQQGLAAQQSAAAVDFARQSVSDQLNLQGSRVNTLQNLAQQAFANQQNLFGLNQNLFNMDLQAAGYEQSRGGGLKGALTGAITGAGAGLQFATGIGNMNNAKKIADSQAGLLDRLGKDAPGIATNLSQVAANVTTPIPQMSAPRIGPSSLAALEAAGSVYTSRPVGPQGYQVYNSPIGPQPPQFSSPSLNPYFNPALFAR